MKKILKLLGYLLGLVVLVIGGIVGTCAATWRPTFPDTPTPDIKASEDPAVIARGEYLFNAVAHCAACHSPQADYMASKPGDIVAPKGGHEWHMGPLGTIRSANITSHPETGIGKYTDGQLARAIRYGVKANDEGAFFMMGVGPMSDEDVTAIVSYVRTIAPVDNAVPTSEIGLMGKVLFQGPMAFFASAHDYAHMMPEYVPEGPASAERGRYLALGPAMCFACHSEYSFDERIEIVGQPLSGGAGNPTPDETEEGYEFVAPNLTPHASSPLANGTLETFTTRLRAGRMYAGSPMPWESFANLTDADIESLWLYLQSLPPTDNNVGPTRRKAGAKTE
jgi:mono/diheme cytochrome c family protein